MRRAPARQMTIEIAPSTARFVVNPVRFRTKYDELTSLLARLEAGAGA